LKRCAESAPPPAQTRASLIGANGGGHLDSPSTRVLGFCKMSGRSLTMELNELTLWRVACQVPIKAVKTSYSRWMARVSQAYLDARRDDIVGAALRCFARDGFDAASMRDIVREAGISAGAVYRYFPSKDELIVAVVRRAVEIFTTSLLEIAAAGSANRQASPAEVFERLLHFLERNPERPRLLLQAEIGALRSPVLAEAFLEGERRIEQILVELIKSYQARGMMSPDLSTADLAAALHGLINAHAATWTLWGERHNQAYRRGVHALLAGLTITPERNGRTPRQGRPPA
jgi:TetR/AcrR family transcriptional regulator, transcriptional repressor of aconitase